jgi:hypothetical protein
MSVNIISLNQMVDLFSGFADRHYFLNDFGFGPTSEIGTSRQMDFPYMWVSLNENSLINPQNRTAIPELSFSVLFMDKTNIQSNYLEINGDNSDNIQEILSDMLQVLQDFITEVQVDWGNYGIIFQDVINCFPATDETQDKVNGWVGQFSFKLKHSNCILPTGDITQTNLSPINPMTRYLTCDTVTACTTLQQYITQQIINYTGNTGTSITGFTYQDNTFTITDDNGGVFSATINTMTGLTVNGDISGTTFYGDGSNLTGIVFNDTFVTGGTYDNSTGTATFTNNSGGTFNVSGFYTGSTDNNQFVTGYTYLNNTFTIADNSGNTFNATINTMTGLTINGNLDVTSIDDVDYIDFNTSAAQAGGIGRLIWDNTDGTLNLGLKGGNVTLQVGQEEVARVVNGTGANLLESQYRAVKIIGAQGQRLQVGLAQADNDANSKDTIGIVTEDINNNQAGFITRGGLVNKINTTGTLQSETWNDGDTLYLSPFTPGVLTNIKPTAPNHTVIIGFVVYSHINNGKIFVKVDNGYELQELHNVQITGTTKGGSLLEYNTSTSVWVDSPIVWTIELINALSVDVYAPYNLSIDTVTNILNAPTITIYDDGVLYTLGNTIAIGSKITVVASVIGVTNLTLSKI